MQLTNIHTLEADLILQTGLHIGAGDGEIHIGGIDNTVIKHPVTGEPYIPGSSLKGKVRSLLEWKSGAVQESPLGQKEYRDLPEKQHLIKPILQLFGISGGKMTIWLYILKTKYCKQGFFLFYPTRTPFYRHLTMPKK